MELLLVIVIIAILTVVAVPSFNTFIQTKRLVNSAQKLYSTLQLARGEAVKRNSTVYVVFQTGTNWCYGANAGSVCTCSTSGNCGLGATTTPRTTDSTMSTSGVTSNRIQFDGTKGIAGSSATILFTGVAQAISIGVKISVLGNLQLCSSTISGYSACT